MLRTLALGAVLAAGLVVPAFAQDAAKVVGTYTYKGTDTDGSAYSDSGKVVVKSVPSARSRSPGTTAPIWAWVR